MNESANTRRPTKWVLAGVGLFLLAVLLGRLLIAGGAAWIALLLVVPILLFAFSAAAGFRFALAATAIFAGTVLAVRWFLAANPLGWILLALLPVLVLSGALVGRVVGLLRTREGRSLEPTEHEILRDEASGPSNRDE
jgi:hypothetical protein